MVECNRFDVSVEVYGAESPKLKIAIQTDLPAGTHVIYSCRRTYWDARGAESLWVGQSGKLTSYAAEDGTSECEAVIDVDSSDQQALAHYQEINFALSPSGISSPISESLTVSLTVGGRQRLKCFGRNNSELSGGLVEDRGGIKVVQSHCEVLVPMKDEFQPMQR